MSSVKRVFISYAHKDKVQSEVGALVQWLKQQGIEALSDHAHLERPPTQGWQAWMLHSIEDADVVLCICGEAYKRGFEKRGGGKGSTWEGAIVTVDLYESGGLNNKFYPILPQAHVDDFVPTLLKPWNNHIALAEWERILALIQAPPTGEKLPPPPPTGTKGPAFRNLQRETDDKRERPTFLRLRFADRAVDYVRPEKVWEAFEGFYASAEPLCWWLIAGGAGSGKSRTALEFCEFLQREKQWHAGFVSLENTDMEVWHAWRPEADTLLVFDYVAREFSGDAGNIARIFTPLMRRAQRNELGGKRIRILLLEREYKERNETGQELDWYAQLDKTMRCQQPFELSSVSDEGLYRLAQQTAKEVWQSPHPLLGLPEFLDKLSKLDKRKRPLFAMLLAGYLAKVNPKAEIAPNELLDFAIEQEFERSWKPAGVENDSTLLRALLLSTCTGGKLGACHLQPRHSLLWNSGLGKLRKEKGQNLFLFYPMEPDLLGERFVLNCAGGNPFKQRIDQKQLEELLKTCWQEAPQETFSFFSRCAQDFASDDSKNIAELFLSSMPTNKPSQKAWMQAFVNLTAFLNPADASKIWQTASQLGGAPDMALWHAKAAFNLVKCCCDAGELPKAHKLFDEMAKLGDTPEVALRRAKATVNLIAHYGKAGNLPEARKLFENMATLCHTPDIALHRAKAAFNLLSDYGKAGNFPEARKLFEEMANFGKTPEISLYLAKAAFNLIVDYCKAANLPEARKLLEDMTEFGGTPEIALWRAKAATCLAYYDIDGKPANNMLKIPESALRRASATYNSMTGYFGENSLPEFENMAAFNDTPEIALKYAEAASELIAKYCNAKKLPEARKLFKEMAGFGDTQEIAFWHAKAAFNLVKGCCNAEDLPEARKLFEDMAGFGDTQRIAFWRAETAFNLILAYCKAGNLSEARQLFRNMVKLVDTPEDALERAKTAFNSILSYCKAGNHSEARQLFKDTAECCTRPEMALFRAKAASNFGLLYYQIIKFPKARKLFEKAAELGNALEHAEATSNLIAAYCKAGKLPEARGLFEDMAELDNTPEIALDRASVASSLIVYYGTAGDFLEVQKLLKDMAELGDTPAIAFWRAKAAFNLIAAYCNAGNLPEARKLFEGMAEFGNTLEVALVRTEADFYLSVLEDMAELVNTPEVASWLAQGG